MPPIPEPWIDIMCLKACTTRRTSATVRPLTAVDIIDADDWLIEHPWPPVDSSTITPSRTSR